MVAAADKRITKPASVSSRLADTDALDHAVKIIYRVCCLAGAADLLDEIRAELRAEGIPRAIRQHEVAALFDWLAAALSYQGISDRVADRIHGAPRPPSVA